MRLRTPTFWYSKDGADSLGAKCLLPISYLYGLARKCHAKSKTGYKASIPVICVGNITAGGSGKTPTALMLYDLIKKTYGDDIRICFLTRGYGGSERGPIVVDPQRHNAAFVGDEALLLAKKGTAIIAADRTKGAKLAENDGHDLIIMDDGMQNPSLHKDLIIVTVDGQKGFGNGLMIPAGPLREPLGKGLARADAVLMIGGHIQADIPENVPILNGHIDTRSDWHNKGNKDFVAFAGLAHPEKFRDTLIASGGNVVGWHPFPDHYPYRDKDLSMLKADAKKHNARLITTAKDAMRLPQDFDVDVLPVILKLENHKPLLTLLRDVIEP